MSRPMSSSATMKRPEETRPSGETDGLARRLREAFARAAHLPRSAVAWELNGTTVVLRGRVRSFYLKQVAQSVALRQSGIARVVNEIEVDGAAERAERRSDSC